MERGRPVTDKVTGEILTEVTIEVVETEAVPTVSKATRLREEVVVQIKRTERFETVTETLRHDEVEIEQVGRKQGKRQLRSLTTES